MTLIIPTNDPELRNFIQMAYEHTNPQTKEWFSQNVPSSHPKPDEWFSCFFADTIPFSQADASPKHPFSERGYNNISNEKPPFLDWLGRADRKMPEDQLSEHTPPAEGVIFRHWLKREHEVGDGGLFSRVRRANISIDSELGALFREKPPELLADFQSGKSESCNRGLDIYAYYLPIHFYYHPDPDQSAWGIYIKQSDIVKIAAALMAYAERTHGPAQHITSFLHAAYEILWQHEMLHFKVEAMALHAQTLTGKALFVPYHYQVYRTTFLTDNCLEEALANASVLNSTRIRQIFSHFLYPEWQKKGGISNWKDVVINGLFKHQPPGYSNYELHNGPHQPMPAVRGKTREIKLWRYTMNYLTNQLLTGKTSLSSQEQSPLYAFPVDNYYLRAEQLVPVYLVNDVLPEHQFVNCDYTFRDKWTQFLRQAGYQSRGGRVGNAMKWVHKNPQLTPILLDDETINHPPRNFDAILKDMGITWNDYQLFLQTGRLPAPLKKL